MVEHPRLYPGVQLIATIERRAFGLFAAGGAVVDEAGRNLFEVVRTKRSGWRVNNLVQPFQEGHGTTWRKAMIFAGFTGPSLVVRERRVKER